MAGGGGKVNGAGWLPKLFWRGLGRKHFGRRRKLEEPGGNSLSENMCLHHASIHVGKRILKPSCSSICSLLLSSGSVQWGEEKIHSQRENSLMSHAFCVCYHALSLHLYGLVHVPACKHAPPCHLYAMQLSFSDENNEAVIMKYIPFQKRRGKEEKMKRRRKEGRRKKY